MINSNEMKSSLPPAVILGGGFSQRMGFPKVFLARDEKPVVIDLSEKLIRCGFGRIAVVVSSDIADKANEAFSDNLEIVVNSEPEDGMISSLRIGLDWAGFSDMGLLALPVDHPLVSEEVILNIQNKVNNGNIVVPNKSGKRGHPTWWGREVWSLLRDPMCDEGAKPLLRGWNNLIIEVATDDPGVLQNINTIEQARRHKLSQWTSTIKNDQI